MGEGEARFCYWVKMRRGDRAQLPTNHAAQVLQELLAQLAQHLGSQVPFAHFVPITPLHPMGGGVGVSLSHWGERGMARLMNGPLNDALLRLPSLTHASPKERQT